MKNNIYEQNHEQILKKGYEFLPHFQQLQYQKGNLGLIEYAYNFCDRVLAKSKIFEKASCNKSCSFCCHSEINISKLESVYIKANIIKNNIIPNQRRKNLQMENDFNTLSFSDKACPFLSDENANGQRLCSIYEFRPLVCRTHNSLSPIKMCNKELYPNTSVKEVRTLESEAIFIGLLLLEKGIETVPKLYKIHNI